MKLRINIRRELRVSVALLGVCFLIGFSERKQGGSVCRNILVDLENEHENHFADEADILRLVLSKEPGLIGSSMDGLNWRAIERELKRDAHIGHAELFGDLKGNLVVRVELRRPIARLLPGAGRGAYVAEDGTIMPVSEKYSSRVLLISGQLADSLMDVGSLYAVDEGDHLMEMMSFISGDPFWRSQVAQLDVDGVGNITIYPQVTGQRIEFGQPVDIGKKFMKLMVFYKEILPQRGWNKYKRVNLEYEGQVIAE